MVSNYKMRVGIVGNIDVAIRTYSGCIKYVGSQYVYIHDGHSVDPDYRSMFISSVAYCGDGDLLARPANEMVYRLGELLDNKDWMEVDRGAYRTPEKTPTCLWLDEHCSDKHMREDAVCGLHKEFDIDVRLAELAYEYWVNSYKYWNR